MKILIAACFYMHNYGSQLQAVALEKKLKEFSSDVVTVNCSNPKIFMDTSKFVYYSQKIFSRYSIKNQFGLFKRKLKLKTDKVYKNNYLLREDSFSKFITSHYKLSSPIKNKNDLFKISKEYDCIVVGSDMLWNPINVNHNYYTLNYCCDEIKKISYATSIGTSNLSKKVEPVYEKFLKRFNSISVREESAVNIVNNCLHENKAQLVLDPTLLLNSSEWDSEFHLENNSVDEEYVFAYFLGDSFEHRKKVKDFCEEKKLKLISFVHIDGYQKSDVGFGDKQVFDAGPIEFVKYIKDAKYIFTDSFHCCTFSIIYEKEFYVFNRFSNNSKTRNNTRIDNLLNMFNLEDRRVLNSITSNKIDYSELYKKLDKYKFESIKYLQDSLIK